MVTKGERQERDKLGVWDSQIQPLCIKQTNNKDLLYNTGNYIKYLVLTYNGKEWKESEEESCTCCTCEIQYCKSAMHVCVLSRFSRVQLLGTLWTVACQAPLSMGFPRQEYWNGLPCPPPRDLPDPGIKYKSPEAPALQADSLPLSHQGSPKSAILQLKKKKV